MKRKILSIAVAALCAASVSFLACKKQNSADKKAKVFVTKQITPESLIAIYQALGTPATGNVAVKISTGEAGNNNYLKPELIGKLVKQVNGTIVECNTAYNGSRMDTANHRKTIANHGFDKIAKVDIMDEEGEIKIPVRDKTYLKYDIVGGHIQNYDSMINLAHFKGHAMGGFGGVLKNSSIGVASSNGKSYIHSAGQAETMEEFHKILESNGQDWVAAAKDYDTFHKCMATTAAAVHDYFKGKKGIVYINVMNNMSVDCDCNGNPAAPKLKDYGILASLDPVALDQACVDIVFNMQPSEGNDNKPLIERINSRHGIHPIEHAAAIELGSRSYELVSID